FQISSINDEDDSDRYYLVTKPSLRVFKSSVVNRCVPGSLRLYHHPVSRESITENGQLYQELLLDQCRSLARLFQPYLAHCRTMPTGTFLLSTGGDPETGRRLVRAASHHWHLHVFEVGALDLVCEVPQSTEAKLRHLFGRVPLYAPCVLLIDQLDLLFRSDI